MNYKNYFTALFPALIDRQGYYEAQKEMNFKAVENTIFNAFAGKETFQAVVLPENLSDSASKIAFNTEKSLRVRPIGLHDFIIPEPCTGKTTEEIKKIIALHPVAYPDNTLPQGGDSEAADVDIFGGQIVECYFIDSGPDNAGSMRGLRYRLKKEKTESLINLTCLGGAERGPMSAFDNGGYSQNQNEIPKEHLGPSNIVDENYVSDPSYSIPASGNDMSPKNIVIHYGGGRSVTGDQKWGKTKKTPSGYHFGVKRNGTVVQFMEPTRRIVHASSTYFNNNAISINFENVGYERKGIPAEEDWIKATNEYSNYTGTWQPYTPAQYEEGGKLIAWLCKTFKMDPTGTSDNGQPTIVGHDYVTVKFAKLHKRSPEDVKSDPGPAFSMEGIRNMAKIKMSEV
jgi:N-acetyl-anhydromuramyl-L-alanine amidase AmpD